MRLGDNIAKRCERYIIGRDTYSRLAATEQEYAVPKGEEAKRRLRFARFRTHKEEKKK